MGMTVAFEGTVKAITTLEELPPFLRPDHAERPSMWCGRRLICDYQYTRSNLESL